MSVEVKELLEAGAHFGHKTQKWNPKMRPFIFTKRSGIHIIDLVKTKEMLDNALNFIKDEASKGKVILFVGTKKQAQETVKDEAIKAGMPYISERWLGGTLTNFQTVIKQVRKFVSLREEKAKGEWEKYSKKEQSVKNKELERLEKSIGGLENLKSIPDIVFIVDTSKEHLAIKEATKMNVPIVGMVDTNADPTVVDHIIPTNDDAIKVIKLIVSKVGDVISSSGSEKPKVKEEAEKDDKNPEVTEEVKSKEEKPEEEKEEGSEKKKSKKTT